MNFTFNDSLLPNSLQLLLQAVQKVLYRSRGKGDGARVLRHFIFTC